MTSSWKSVVLFAAVTCAVSACGGDSKGGSFEGVNGKAADAGTIDHSPRADGGTDSKTDAGTPIQPSTLDGGVDVTRDAGPTLPSVPRIPTFERDAAVGPALPTTSSDDRVVAGTATLEIVNRDLYSDVVAVYLARAGTRPTGNLLDGQTLGHGEGFDITEVPCDEPLDLAVTDSNDVTLEETDVILDCDDVTTYTITAS